jgi:hypothetical protein
MTAMFCVIASAVQDIMARQQMESQHFLWLTRRTTDGLLIHLISVWQACQQWQL